MVIGPHQLTIRADKVYEGPVVIVELRHVLRNDESIGEVDWPTDFGDGLAQLDRWHGHRRLCVSNSQFSR